MSLQKEFKKFINPVTSIKVGSATYISVKDAIRIATKYLKNKKSK